MRSGTCLHAQGVTLDGYLMIKVVWGLFLLSIGPVEHEESDAEGDERHPGHAADHEWKPGGVCRGLLGGHPDGTRESMRITVHVLVPVPGEAGHHLQWLV